MKNIMREKEGITLIALVVTIIVLIILAGVSIQLLLGQNGIVGKSKQAKEEYINAEMTEKEDLNELYSSIQIAGNSKITLTTEELDEYINQKIQEELRTFNATRPTGIKTDTYVGGSSKCTTTYNITPAMSIFTLSTDENNKIGEYLTYTKEEGYTVLKSRLVFYRIDLTCIT